MNEIDHTIRVIELVILLIFTIMLCVCGNTLSDSDIDLRELQEEE